MIIKVEQKAALARAQPEVLPPFDYRALSPTQARLARDAAEFIGHRHRGMSVAVLEIGQKLIDVKASLGHGHFTAWVQAEFTMTMRTAQDYMAASARVGGKSEVTSYLPVTTLLELAKAPEPARQKVLEQMDAAHLAAAPLPVGKVKEILSAAKDEGKTAAKSPARRAMEKARQAKVQAERDARQAAKDEANSKVAVLIAERFGAELPQLVAAVDVSTDYGNLARWLRRSETGLRP